MHYISDPYFFPLLASVYFYVRLGRSGAASPQLLHVGLQYEIVCELYKLMCLIAVMLSGKDGDEALGH